MAPMPDDLTIKSDWIAHNNPEGPVAKMQAVLADAQRYETERRQRPTIPVPRATLEHWLRVLEDARKTQYKTADCGSFFGRAGGRGFSAANNLMEQMERMLKQATPEPHPLAGHADF